jgi:hypothetical protein
MTLSQAPPTPEEAAAYKGTKGDQPSMPKAKMFATTFFIAALALTALAASAFATTPGWMVNGTMLSGSQALATTAAVDSPGILTVTGVVTITCTGSTLNGVSPQIQSPSSGSASSLVFTGCGTGGGNCSLSGQNAGGTIATLPVTAEATLGVSPTVQATFKPTGSQFATFAFTGSKCSLSGTNPVKGEILTEAPTGRTEQTLQLISAITTAASGKLKIGADAASLTASALLKLANSQTWSYLSRSRRTVVNGNDRVALALRWPRTAERNGVGNKPASFS